MSTFAKASFNAAIYSASRPTYPNQLFEYIFAFHRHRNEAKWERAVDLGCGTGQATAQLRPFREVVAVDPSEGMLEKAQAHIARLQPESPSKADGPVSGTISPHYKFLQGSAEDLSKTLSDESVDLLVAAQACHWFDWSKVWPETQRVLRSGGTAAFWVYGEFRLTQFPSLTPLITIYAQGSDPQTSLGPHFQRPGRTILERHLVDVPEPSVVLGDNNKLGHAIQRVYFCGDDIPPFIPEDAPKRHILMRSEMRWRDLLSYFRTWSAFHTYHEKYPEDLKAAEDTRFLREDLDVASEPVDDLRGGDISIRFWKDLRQEAKIAQPDAKVGVDDKVEVEWPLALLLVRKD